MRFLGIILRVLRLEVAVFKFYITNFKSKNSASEPVYKKSKGLESQLYKFRGFSVCSMNKTGSGMKLTVTIG